MNTDLKCHEGAAEIGAEIRVEPARIADQVLRAGRVAHVMEVQVPLRRRERRRLRPPSRIAPRVRPMCVGESPPILNSKSNPTRLIAAARLSSLDQVEVTLGPSEVPRVVHVRGDGHEAARWTLANLAVGPGCAAALAIRTRVTAVVGCGWDGGGSRALRRLQAGVPGEREAGGPAGCQPPVSEGDSAVAAPVTF